MTPMWYLIKNSSKRQDVFFLTLISSRYFTTNGCTDLRGFEGSGYGRDYQKNGGKYYGKWEAAIGGLLRLDNIATVKVAGSLDDVPANTDFILGLLWPLMKQ